MTAQEATAEVFLTAFRALPRGQQESILGQLASDRKYRRVLENISDRLVLEEEQDKPSRPLRQYIEARERRRSQKAPR